MRSRWSFLLVLCLLNFLEGCLTKESNTTNISINIVSRRLDTASEVVESTTSSNGQHHSYTTKLEAQFPTLSGTNFTNATATTFKAGTSMLTASRRATKPTPTASAKASTDQTSWSSSVSSREVSPPPPSVLMFAALTALAFGMFTVA